MSKRMRRGNRRFQDYMYVDTERSKQSKARYTIVLQSNEEHHDVPLNQLESLSGLPLRPEEATPGTSVVWLYKKTPYEATIVDPPDQLYSETDSSDSDQESQKPKQFKSDHKQPSHKQPNLPKDPTTTISTNPLTNIRTITFSSSDRELLITIDRRLRNIEKKITTSNETSSSNSQQPSYQILLNSQHTSNSQQASSYQQTPNTCSSKQPSSYQETSSKENDIFSDGGIEVQVITGGSPEKYALNLMDTLFTDEEMRGHLFIKSAKSKSSREALPQDRVKKLIAMVAAKFGKEKTRQSFESIKLKCNQKCRDKEKVGGDLDDGILDAALEL